jgi:murein DD-endopeptidase MepM/ murein hydrolase activator NlpD
MSSLRTSWLVIVTRHRVIRMPLSRLVGCVGVILLAGALVGAGSILRWREDYRGWLQDLAWLRQGSAAKLELVQEQHRALSALVGELSQLREESLELQSLRDQVRVLGHLEGEHDVSKEVVRSRPLETPVRGSATVMLGYAYEDIDVLRNVTRETTDTLSLLVALLEDQTGIRPDIPSVWPVVGKRSISSPFGWRRSPLSHGNGYHRGIDIRGPYGKPIVAAADGRVTYAGRDPGYGNLVVLNHGSGIYTWYGHLSRIHVRKGAEVARGERIGALGSTGQATGPHLHFEVRVNGVPVNPERYFVN